MVAVLAALGAAGAYAAASVLQQRAAVAQPEALSMRVALLVRLARRPAWLAGVAADVGGYALQFVALGLGSLAVVQPLLVSGLLIALPLSARMTGRRLTNAEWRGAAYVVVGLAVFLVVARPARGATDATGHAWLAVSVATLLPAGALVTAAMRSGGRLRAGALAAAAGLLYGYTAALTKTSAHLLSLGVGHVLGAWQPYVLAGGGGAAMLLAQSAFQAAPLDASLPLLTVVDPLCSVAIGALVFHETLTSSVPAVGLEVVAVALLTLGVFNVGQAQR
ncbi:MAG TPA: DMT family transporter [Acidimicrobiales bacterium]|nr:DMT family transporter [Acidimicrobiales bacterium]